MVEKRRKDQGDAQSKLFIETARNLGCDEDADADEVMRRLVAQQKRTPSKKTSNAKKKATK